MFVGIGFCLLLFVYLYEISQTTIWQIKEYQPCNKVTISIKRRQILYRENEIFSKCGSGPSSKPDIENHFLFAKRKSPTLQNRLSTDKENRHKFSLSWNEILLLSNTKTS